MFGSTTTTAPLLPFLLLLLLGIDIAHALPTTTATTVQARTPQWWLGPPSSSFTPGDPGNPPCIIQEGVWICMPPGASGDLRPGRR